jgi:hypothetical protein
MQSSLTSPQEAIKRTLLQPFDQSNCRRIADPSCEASEALPRTKGAVRRSECLPDARKLPMHGENLDD